jgi:hypothetical protein
LEIEKPMMEPSVWMQLGISDDRYSVISKEIASIIKTKETIGNMMLMIQSSKMNHDEQLYAAFMVAKTDIQNKLVDKMPPMGRSVIKKMLEE